MTEAVSLLRTSLAGRYELERELGSGGMATVYLARDVKHDRDVAIKVLHPELGAALGSERFLSEIKTTAKLQHPHILPLLDSGEANGLLYYVMPYITGETLRQRLEREEQLPINTAITIAKEVADALSAAHEMGIVHRDIKPENILLRGNHALVADFGIALAVQQAGGARMTQTGLSLGTPQYMSPEQAMGERNIGPKSDIYSLGAVTYEMITGDPPFTGHSVQAIVAKVLTEQPTPVSTVRDTVPPHVEDAVLTALSKLPADRFATATEFASALADESRPTTLRTVTRRTSASPGILHRLRDPLVLGLVAGIVLLAVVSGILAIRPSAPDDAVVTRVAMAFPEAQKVEPQWRGFNVALSNDASRLAYIGTGPTPNTTQLWVRPLDALEASPVPGTVGVTSVRLSADGRSALLTMMDEASSAPNAVMLSLDGGRGTVLPGAGDGEIGASGVVYYPIDDSLSIMIGRQSPGGARDTLRVSAVTPQRIARSFNPGALALTLFPDESAVMITTLADSLGVYADANIVGVSLSSGKATVVGKGIYAKYLSSGHLLYVSASGDIFVAPFDPRTFRITGKATVVGRAALTSNAGRVYPQVTASQNGTLVYIGGELSRQRLVWLDAQGRVTERLTGEGNFWGIALSPDGSRVALSIREDERIRGANARGTGDIFVEDMKTGARTRLTSGDLNVRPSWSADGRFVLFTRVGGRERQSLVERRADASAPEQLVLSRQSFRNSVGDGRWLPDHRTLIVRTYAGTSTNSRDLYYVTTGDTTVNTVAATPADEHTPAPSPDGNLIAYVSAETGTPEIYVQPFPSGTGRLRISNGGGGGPRWSRDGRLYYWDRGRLKVVSIQSRPSLAVLSVREIGGNIMPSVTSPYTNLGYDVAPDGRILATEPVPGTFSVVLVRNWLSEIQH